MSSQSAATKNVAFLAGLGSVARPLTLTLATITTGLIAGFFYAYACSVTLGLALLPDEQDVEAMQGSNATGRTRLIAGCFSPYACSVTLGLALLPDEQYVEAMQAINATVRNGLFAFSFFGAVLSLLLALTVHAPRLRSRRFLLVALAAVLYIGGGFMLTFLINVPMNEELARVGVDGLGPAAVAQIREGYEG